MSPNGPTSRGYEAGERIGTGGYGEVYRATQASVDREVAIKVILPQYASNPQFVADFETEAKLIAQLEHPNIVPLHDFWQDETGAYLVMRYVPGGNLKDMIAKGGMLPLTRTVRLIEQIGDALQTAHDANVVHRDIKPANILIDRRGNAYLTDFGIAKQLSKGDTADNMEVKGTFAYMSPEQVHAEAVTAQTDIYALGVMLYEMLAGRHPWHETPVSLLVVKHLQEPLPDIRDVREDLSEAIEAVIQKATAKYPADRYASVLDMVSDLKAAVSGQVAAPLPVPAKSKPSTVEGRNRKAMLTNVYKFWVEGVLENSLHNTVMIELGKQSHSNAVNSPWDTLIRTPAGNESFIDARIVDVFDRLNGKLLILGEPGGGKTTTLLALARDLLARAEADEQHPIPVVFNLSSWREHHNDLSEWLVEELNSKYQVPRKVGAAWVKNDELLLLLDGLDEVARNLRGACINTINTYREEHGFVDVVVCSRIKDYEALEARLTLAGAILIQPLDTEQIQAYLAGLGQDVAVVGELIARDAQLRELAQSPLMLSIMVLTYRGSTVEDVPNFDDLEVQRHNLFETYVARAFDRRGDANRYTQLQTLQYLQWLAKQMHLQARSVLNIEDIAPHWIKDLNDLTLYIFVARGSFVVAMALALGLATFIVGVGTGLLPVLPITLAGMLTGAIGGWLVSRTDPHNTNPLWNLIPGGLLAACIAALFTGERSSGLFYGLVLIGFVLGFATYTILRIIYVNLGNGLIAYQRIETVQWDIRTWWKPQLILVGLASAVIVNGLGIVINPDMTLANFLMGTLLSIPPMTMIVLVMGTARSTMIESRTMPNQGIWDSLANANRVSAIVATLWGLGLLAATPTLTPQLAVPLAIASFAASVINAWLVSGGFVFVEHMLVRAVFSYQHRYIPLNLADFLDYAVSLILLRKVGGGYIFIHRYLLEYFAALEPDPPQE